MTYQNAKEINKLAHFYSQCFDVLQESNPMQGSLAVHLSEMNKAASADADRESRLYKQAALHPEFVVKMAKFLGVTPEAVVNSVETNIEKLAAFTQYSPELQQAAIQKVSSDMSTLAQLSLRKRALQDSSPISMASVTDPNMAPSQWNQMAGFVPGVGEGLDIPEVEDVALMSNPVDLMSATMDNDDVANQAQAQVNAETVAKAAAVDAYLSKYASQQEGDALLNKVASGLSLGSRAAVYANKLNPVKALKDLARSKGYAAKKGITYGGINFDEAQPAVVNANRWKAVENNAGKIVGGLAAVPVVGAGAYGVHSLMQD